MMKEHELQELLRNLPEREVPLGMSAGIMAQVMAVKPTFLERLGVFFRGGLGITIRPARLALVTTALALAFYLGTLSTVPGVDTGALPAVASLSPEASFYIGRGLLNGGAPEKAMIYLRRAATLAPGVAEYKMWQAVSWQAAGRVELERGQFLGLAKRHPQYLPAVINFGHRQLQNGDLDGAMRSYRQILTMAPGRQEVLYNIGLIYRLQGDQEGERRTWKKYLSLRRSGNKSYLAVRHLNELGDYSYRTARLGYRQIIISSEALLAADESIRGREISRLARQFNRVPGRVLDLVVFDAAGLEKARGRARTLQGELRRELVAGKEVRISWFGQAESIRRGKGKVVLDQGVLFFSLPKNQRSLQEQRI